MALTNHWTKVSCRLLVIHFLSTLISHGEAACTELEQMECSNVENSSLLNIYSEVYGSDSQCFSTSFDNRCYLAACVQVDTTLRINIRGEWFTCVDDQELDVQVSNAAVIPLTLQCPLTQEACPGLFPTTEPTTSTQPSFAPSTQPSVAPAPSAIPSTEQPTGPLSELDLDSTTPPTAEPTADSDGAGCARQVTALSSFVAATVLAILT